MKLVTNSKERNYALVKFIFFFSVTVAIIVAAVYFDTLIPKKENEVLRNRIRDYENQVYNQKQFIAAIENVKSLIDSSSKLSKDYLPLDYEIAKQLDLIKSQQSQDSSFYSQINKNMYIILYEYKNTNKRLIESNNKLQEVDKLKTELDQSKKESLDWENKYKQSETNLDFYRKNISS